MDGEINERIIVFWLEVARHQSQTQNQTQAEIIQTTKKPDIEEEKRLELEIGLERIKKLMQKLNETKQANKFYPPGINVVIFHFLHVRS